ncbi:MAG: hypothetical protein RBT69_08320 [Spirochaetia bacterium]|nr:hypothetical protein [Spirochaetia bacterium]
MKKILSAAAVILLLFLYPVSFASSQDESEPDWVLFQKGMYQYRNKDFSGAFKYFRKASEKREYPEAEYWIGRIFENEGEQNLALKQYERALEYSWKAESEEFYVSVLTGMANVYEKQKKYNLYHDVLEKLINEIKKKSTVADDYELILSERLKDNGLDKMIYYFRHEGDSLIKPYGDLGIFYFSHSRESIALRYFASAITIITSELIAMHREYDPQYTYTDYKQLFTDSENDEKKIFYMIETNFYKYLFYLALTLENMGIRDQSEYIFSILAQSRVKSNFRDMSARIKNNNYSPVYIRKVAEAHSLTSD